MVSRLLSVLLLVSLAVVWSQQQPTDDSLQCSVPDDAERDPALQEMKYDVGDGEQTTLVYVEPSVASMYPPDSPLQSSTRVVSKFNGLAGKFINMSNKKVTLFW